MQHKHFEAIWYLEFNGQREGPYSIQQLRHHPKVTPDTLVWRKGFSKAIPMRQVPELKAVFEDEETIENPALIVSKDPAGELTADMNLDLPPFFWLLLLLSLFLSFMIFQIWHI